MKTLPNQNRTRQSCVLRKTLALESFFTQRTAEFTGQRQCVDHRPKRPARCSRAILGSGFFCGAYRSGPSESVSTTTILPAGIRLRNFDPTPSKTHPSSSAPLCSYSYSAKRYSYSSLAGRTGKVLASTVDSAGHAVGHCHADSSTSRSTGLRPEYEHDSMIECQNGTVQRGRAND